MVDSIGSTLPPSVQAVNKARSNAQTQKSESTAAASPADEVSLSTEAQELGEVNRLASDTGQILRENPDETLGSASGSFESFL